MTERDLFVEVKRDGTPIDVEGWACASIDEAMHRSTMVVAKCQLQRYIPAPTWRPIAEMPPEWRDGREVTLSGYGEKHVAAFDGLYWVTGHGRKVGPVTHYLDIAIPEVPRG